MKRLALFGLLALAGCCGGVCILRRSFWQHGDGPPSTDTSWIGSSRKQGSAMDEQVDLMVCRAKMLDAGTAWDGRLPCP